MEVSHTGDMLIRRDSFIVFMSQISSYDLDIVREFADEHFDKPKSMERSVNLFIEWAENEYGV